MIRGSTLSLLVLRILTDHHDFAMALDDLALVANFLYGRFDFHSLFHLSRIIGRTGASALRPPRDPSLRGVVDRNFDLHIIPGKDLDIVHSKFPGDMSSHDHIIGKLDLEGGVRQSLNDRSLKFDHVIFRHKSFSLPPRFGRLISLFRRIIQRIVLSEQFSHETVVGS